tara:strand:+ start:22765 stop:23622 length:858 start_codon:yes stop_codon:yes gene_type:complete
MEKSVPPKLADLLTEDSPLPGQKFACISFVSPENILKRKELFLFENFLKNWDFEKSFSKYNQFTNFISYKYNLNAEDLQKDLKDFVKEEKNALNESNLLDDYKNFIDANETKLEQEFNEMNSFRTTTRGIKVRGVFETQQEAELRCKLLREMDSNHDVYVGPVGFWMPWEPDAYKTGKVEYLEDELNQLMHEKEQNETKAKMQFNARVEGAKKSAIEENKKNALESNNKLTQNIDNKGNLYSVSNGEDSEVSMADIKKELFDTENVILKGDKDKKTDGDKLDKVD